MNFVLIKKILLIIFILKSFDCNDQGNISNQKIFSIKNENDANRAKRLTIDENICEKLQIAAEAIKIIAALNKFNDLIDMGEPISEIAQSLFCPDKFSILNENVGKVLKKLDEISQSIKDVK